MNNNSSDPREALWRKSLSPAELGTLKGSPELEVEARLTASLLKIPDAHVPSNFTARVLAAVDLEENQTSRSRDWTLNWRQLWPRFAVATAVLIFCGSPTNPNFFIRRDGASPQSLPDMPQASTPLL